MDIHIRRERIQRFVEVVDLHEDAHDHDDRKHIRAGMRELVAAAQRKLESDTKALDRHDRDRANKRANRDVYEWV